MHEGKLQDVPFLEANMACFATMPNVSLLCLLY